MMSLLDAVHLAVLARAPIPGRAKTRLIPALGEFGAARLHRQMVLQTLAKAHAAKIGPVTLWGTSEKSERFFRALMRCGVRYKPQPTGDLGERMRSVMVATLPSPTILIGSDCPPLTPEHLRAANNALLAGQDAVFIPVEDGGYALIGLNKAAPSDLFLNMPWGSCSVMAETRTRLNKLGFRWTELATLWDMDRPEDLERLSLSTEFKS